MNRIPASNRLPFILTALLTAAVLTPFASSARAFEPTDPVEYAVYNERLIPAPQSVDFGRGIVVFNEKLQCVLLLDDETRADADFDSRLETLRVSASEEFAADLRFVVASPKEYADRIDGKKASSDDAAQFLAELNDAPDFFGRANAYRCLTVPDPAYASDSDPETLTNARTELAGTIIIAAADFDGLRDAFKTLRQASETFGVSASTASSQYLVPEMKIDDAPALAFRGLHLCWFPETDPKRLESAIRIAAYYKFNYVVLEFWGVFPFETSDALCWSEIHTTKEEVRRLVALGKELGVTLVPQMNLWGHAAGARESVGKHAVLDFHPELEPLFEPDGWTWNIYNPAARELLTGCVLELCDVFDNPPFFHIGCDEAYSAGTNFMARRKGNYADAMAEWLGYFHDLLGERNCRMMMWHDMLVQKSEFRGYVANGKASEEGVLDKLPKDVLICDWQYNAPGKDETWPTSVRFREKGFETIMCPWREAEGIRSLGKNAADAGGFGLLCTTWHMFYLGDMRNILIIGASSGWGTRYRGAAAVGAFNRHLRQADRGIGDKNYRTGGVSDWQVLKETYGPR